MEGGYSLALLQDDIIREDKHMRASVPPGKRLAVILHFLAKGNTYMDTADMFGLGTSTVNYILHETVGVLNHHFFAREIRFPADGQEPVSFSACPDHCMCGRWSYQCAPFHSWRFSIPI